MKTGKEHHATLSHFVVVTVISLAAVLGFALNFKPTDHDLEVEAAASCNNLTNNSKIVCFAKNLSGYRYANALPGGDDWEKNWGQKIVSSFGQLPQTWYTQERLNKSSNFLECSGYINVIFYLANNSKEVFSKKSSQDYVKDKRFKEIKGGNFYKRLQPGDLVVRKKIGKQAGHVAVFTGMEGKNIVLYEASSYPDTNGQQKTGKRIWPPKLFNNFFSYGLRWTTKFPKNTIGAFGKNTTSQSSLTQSGINTQETEVLDYSLDKSIEEGETEPLIPR